MKTGTAIASALMAACLLVGCEPEQEECEKNHTGSISMQNTSGDVFSVIIDGDDEGKVYPFDTESFTVDVGEHTVEIRREDGSEVCSSITVYVDECENEGLCCPYCT